jgi:hypothetical protein
LEAAGIQVSMSAIGNGYDNAAQEVSLAPSKPSVPPRLS